MPKGPRFAALFAGRKNKMDYINLPRFEYIKIENAILKIQELPFLQYLRVFQLIEHEDKNGLVTNQKEIINILNSWAVAGKIEGISYSQLNDILDLLNKVNDPGECVILPEDKKSEFTAIKYNDAVFTRLADIIASEYNISPLEILKTLSIRQILIYYALIYNRRISAFPKKDNIEIIYIPGIGQEVAKLPRKLKLQYYAEKLAEKERAKKWIV